MYNKNDIPRVILMGGSSHSGKSTLAQDLAYRLDADNLSTDSLARHPGRPWRATPDLIPAHVRTHYASLPVATLVAEVLAHYQRLWPRVQSHIEKHLEAGSARCLVVEGSALWPALVSPLLQNLEITARWLTVRDEVFRTRIYDNSNYYRTQPPEQQLIDQFLARTIGFNKLMMDQVHRLHLPYIDTEDSLTYETFLTSFQP